MDRAAPKQLTEMMVMCVCVCVCTSVCSLEKECQRLRHAAYLLSPVGKLRLPQQIRQNIIKGKIHNCKN